MPEGRHNILVRRYVRGIVDSQLKAHKRKSGRNRLATREDFELAFATAIDRLRKAGLKYDIMTTSFFLGRRTLKASPTSGMPNWQDRLFIALSRQSTNATDFFSIPSDRVVELGAQVAI